MIRAGCWFCRWELQRAIAWRRGQFITRRRWWKCADCGAETEE